MEPGLLKSADWPFAIDLYFFLGGLAGGAFVIATIAHLLDRQRYRDVVRVGYYVAFLALIPTPFLLILDLGLPTRFLHMMMVGKPSVAIGMDAVTVGPFHLKPFSPMSVGAWALLVFGGLSTLAALDVFLEDRGGKAIPNLRTIVGLIGGVFGFFIAAYPGVLLGATARPLFVSAHWLGALFLAVGASTGGAVIALLLTAAGARSRDAIAGVLRITTWALVLEAVALALFIVSVAFSGSTGVSRALGPLIGGPYGVLFWVGAVVIGLLVPLAMAWGGIARRGSAMAALASVLVLIGGFVVKYVIVAAGQVSA